jgi:hypothetical protein
MDKIIRVTISLLFICLVFLGCIILFSCLPKQQSNETMPSQEENGALPSIAPIQSAQYMHPQETKDVPFIYNGAINITNNLNIRSTPSTKGNILRQSSFGEYFSIYEKRGSGNIENGVMDLWYRVSTEGEWINGLYLRTFPFYIASDETFPDNIGKNYGFNLNTVIIKIEGYREMDGKKELKVKISAHHAFTYEGEVQVATRDFGDPGYSDQIIELLEKYLIDPFQRNIITEENKQQNERNYYSAMTWHIINSGAYNVKFIDNNFDNLINYSLELEKIVRNYETRFSHPYDYTEVEPNVKVFSFHDDTNDVIYEFIYDKRYELEATTIKIDRLSSIILNGINIKNKKEDIILLFGNNFSTEEYSHNGIFVEHIIYYFCKSDYPYKIEFIFNGGRVQQILYSQMKPGK